MHNIPSNTIIVRNRTCVTLTAVQVVGRENLPPSDRPVVYVANHQSFLVRAQGKGAASAALGHASGDRQESAEYILGMARDTRCTLCSGQGQYLVSGCLQASANIRQYQFA